MSKLTVVQTLPALNSGGVERGTLEVAAELVKRGHRSIVVSGGGELLEELQQTGSEHILLPIGKKSPFTLGCIFPLRAALRQSNATILHARSRLPAWISYLTWKGMADNERPRFVTSVHGPYTVNAYSKIMMAGERVIAVSEFIHHYIVENYPDISADKIVTIPRGVSNQKYPFAYQPDPSWLDRWYRQYPQLINKRLITLPARLTRWKGQEDFLHILAKLSDAKLPVHGLIVGGPHPRKQQYADELLSLARKLGVQDRVTFTGHRSDLKEIMSVSAIVLSLSGEPEAFGRTVLESLCLGTPVIAYAHGGAAEIMNKMFPVGLVSKHDLDAATRLIINFLEKKQTVPTNNPFTLQNMLDQTINLYEQLLVAPHVIKLT